jgi:hypothetical protein
MKLTKVSLFCAFGIYFHYLDNPDGVIGDSEDSFFGNENPELLDLLDNSLTFLRRYWMQHSIKISIYLASPHN